MNAIVHTDNPYKLFLIENKKVSTQSERMLKSCTLMV